MKSKLAIDCSNKSFLTKSKKNSQKKRKNLTDDLESSSRSINEHNDQEFEALNFSYSEYLKLKFQKIFCCMSKKSLSQNRLDLYKKGIEKFKKNFDISNYMLQMGRMRTITKLILKDEDRKIMAKH